MPELDILKLHIKVLDKMPNRDVVSWNALLSAYVEKAMTEIARDLFDEMEA